MRTMLTSKDELHVFSQLSNRYDINTEMGKHVKQ